MNIEINTENTYNCYTEPLQSCMTVGDKSNKICEPDLSLKGISQTAKKESVYGGGFSEESAVYIKSEEDIFPTYKNGTISSSAVSSACSSYNIGQIKTYLRDLGFYSGELGGAFTNTFAKSLENFKLVYGGSETVKEGSASTNQLYGRILSVGTKYYQNLTGERTAKILEATGLTNAAVGEYNPKKSIARILTFLEEGMGCKSSAAIAGILGNLKHESNFSSYNAQESAGYIGNYDISYKYNINDGVAYGIMQWKFYTRKQGLLDMAGIMGSSVSDMNVQLAYMREELNTDFKTSWESLKQQKTYQGACSLFQNAIEMSPSGSGDRMNWSKKIYDVVK